MAPPKPVALKLPMAFCTATAPVNELVKAKVSWLASLVLLMVLFPLSNSVPAPRKALPSATKEPPPPVVPATTSVPPLPML